MLFLLLCSVLFNCFIFTFLFSLKFNKYKERHLKKQLLRITNKLQVKLAQLRGLMSCSYRTIVTRKLTVDSPSNQDISRRVLRRAILMRLFPMIESFWRATSWKKDQVGEWILLGKFIRINNFLYVFPRFS